MDAEIASILNACTNASVTQIDVVHPSGTGQKVSDSAELYSIQHALLPQNHPHQFLAILNHKANFGHTFGSSGIISIITSVLAMVHMKIPRHLGLKHPIDALLDQPMLIAPTIEGLLVYINAFCSQLSFLFLLCPSTSYHAYYPHITSHVLLLLTALNINRVSLIWVSIVLNQFNMIVDISYMNISVYYIITIRFLYINVSILHNLCIGYTVQLLHFN